MMITENMTTCSSFIINGSGKLMIMGNLNQTGGSISVYDMGILVVGGSFKEGWQTTNLFNNAMVLVIHYYNVNGRHENGTRTKIAVLGTVLGGGCSGCTNTIPPDNPA